MDLKAWELREPRPRGTRYSESSGALYLPDRWSGSSWSPIPFVQAEAEVWVRPSTAACFPLHSIGAAELYARAANLVTPIVKQYKIEGERRDMLADRLWWAALMLFRAGHSVRTSIDAFVDHAKYMPGRSASLSSDENDAIERLALLAAGAVVRAATLWAAEVK
jgi:hypothetical protein